jgi:hypothetical protein
MATQNCVMANLKPRRLSLFTHRRQNARWAMSPIKCPFTRICSARSIRILSVPKSYLRQNSFSLTRNSVSRLGEAATRLHILFIGQNGYESITWCHNARVDLHFSIIIIKLICFEVFKAVVLRDVTTCSIVGAYPYFRGIYCLHLQGCSL